MAKTDLEQLVVKMSADLSRFEKQMLKAQGVSNQAAGRIQKRFNDMNKGLTGSFGLLGSSLKGAFAALSVEKIVSTVVDLVKSVADIGDAADKLGVTTDEFQQMQFAAKLAGVETEQLVQGMKKLAINSSEASRGQGDLGKIFAANGVSIRDQNGALLSQTQILAIVAELIRNAANEQDQAAIAQAAFGKSGIDLLNLLQQGAAGVTRAMQQAKDAGVTFSEEQIRKAQQIDDAFDTLSAKILTSLKSSFLDFADTTIREWDLISQAIATSQGYVESWIGSIVQATQASAALAQTVAAGKVDRETPLTPGAFGKGDLPANIGSQFQLVRPTIIPGPVTRPTSTRTPRAAGPDEYQRSTQQIQENIKVLQAERDAILANVTATTGYDAAVEKARITEQLMNDARAAGIRITPELTANIDKLAGAYSSMQAQVDAARLKHEEFVKSLEETKALSKDVLGGFIDDLRNGESALDALGNALDKVIDSLIDMAINNLVENAFSGASSSSGGGLLGGLFGSLFGGGGSSFAGLYANGGSIPSGKWGIAGEAGPEIVRGPASVTPIGRAASGTKTQITIVQNISANGDRTVAEIAFRETSRALRDFERQRPSIDIERRLRTA